MDVSADVRRPREDVAVNVYPPEAVSVPVTEGVNVSVLPEPTTVIADVSPFVVLVDVASVTAGPVAV